MKHYSRIEWSNLVTGIVSRDVEVEMHEHLLECNECLNVYLSIIDDSIEIHSAGLLSPDFTDRVMNSIEKENQRLQAIRLRKTYNNLIVYYIAAACITLFFMSSGIFEYLSRKIPETSTRFSQAQLGSSNTLFSGWTDRLVEKTSSLVNGFPKNK